MITWGELKSLLEQCGVTDDILVYHIELFEVDAEDIFCYVNMGNEKPFLTVRSR